MRYFIEVIVDNPDSEYVKKELETLVKCDNVHLMKINNLEYKFGEVVLDDSKKKGA